jgi:hypothetical protein
MKYVFVFITFFCLLNKLSAQNVYIIKADSVKLTNCDSSELILENHTQGVPGFLFNTGNGRTIFKRGAQKLNDSMYLIGADTLRTQPNAWVRGGNSFGGTGILGSLDNNHVDLYTNNLQRGRLTNTGNLLLGTTSDDGYMFDASGSVRTKTSLTITSTVAGNLGDFSVSPVASGFSGGSFNMNMGGWLFVNDFATVFSGTVSSQQGFATPGHVQTGSLQTNGPATFLAAAGNVDNYIYMGAGTQERKAAIIEKALGSWGIMDMNFAFSTTEDTTSVHDSSTKVIFRANGNVLIGSRTDNGNRFQVSGSSSFDSSMGIGTSSPTAQLHTTGTVRFAGLTNDNSQARIVVSDGSGNLFYRDASSLAFNDPIRSSLAVNGTITAQRLKISPTGWPDYVFDSSYQLLPMEQLEKYIKKNNHLPGISSAAEVEKKGVDVGDNQAALLRKIEELTLYNISQEKRLRTQDKRMEEQAKKMETLETEIAELKKFLTNKSAN